MRLPAASAALVTLACLHTEAAARLRSFGAAGGALGRRESLGFTSQVGDVLVNVANGGFETGCLSTDVDQASYQDIPGWSRLGGAVCIPSNNAAWGFLYAPEGSYYAALHGTGSALRQVVPVPDTSKTYALTFQAAARGPAALLVMVNGAQSKVLPQQGIFSQYAVSFMAPSGNATIAFIEDGTEAGDVAVLLDKVQVLLIQMDNPGFESGYAGIDYTGSVSGWVVNGSATTAFRLSFHYGAAIAPMDGNYYAGLDGNYSGLAQNVSGHQAGMNYKLTFWAAEASRNAGSAPTMQAFVDGNLLLSFSPGASFRSFTLIYEPAASVVQFQFVNSSPDPSTSCLLDHFFIDIMQ